MPKNFGMPGNAWRYALDSDYGYCSPLLDGIEFENEWVTIRESAIRIRAGYAWDGCSPCICVLGLFYVGTPDGAQHLGLPATYHASLVHDVLCQWRADIPVSRAQSIAIFHQLLREVRFPLAGLYAGAVFLFGPRRGFMRPVACTAVAASHPPGATLKRR